MTEAASTGAETAGAVSIRRWPSGWVLRPQPGDGWAVEDLVAAWWVAISIGRRSAVIRVGEAPPVRLYVGKSLVWAGGAEPGLSGSEGAALLVGLDRRPPTDETLGPLLDPQLVRFGQVLAAELDRPSRGEPDDAVGEALLSALVIHLERLAGGPIAGPADWLPTHRLAAIDRYIDAHLTDRITVAELARLAGISASHFSRTFRSSTGLPPYRYVTRRRLERARSWLAETDLPVAEIATRVGFSDQSHLTRMLRRHGMPTPTAYRQALRAESEP